MKNEMNISEKGSDLEEDQSTQNNTPTQVMKNPYNNTLKVKMDKKTMGCVVEAIHKLSNFQSKKDREKRKLSLTMALKEMSIEEETQNDSKPLSRFQIYDYAYSVDYDIRIFDEDEDLSFSLKRHLIQQGLRAKMVDWIIEVYGNYIHTTSNDTFFRSVALLDYFLKKTPRQLKDGEVHLLGIVCMFIATKLEDIYHIPLQDMFDRVAHRKFSCNQIKQLEWEVLNVIQFQVSFPTSYTYLIRYNYRCFLFDDSQVIQNIKETSIYMLKMCVHDYQMTSYPQHVLALSVFVFSVRCYFSSLMEDENQNSQTVNKQEQILMKKINNLINQSDKCLVEECQSQVKQLSQEWDKKYPDLQNLQKFALA